MAREEKQQIIAQLQELFARCNVGILVDFRGLPTSEMTALRRKLQESNIEYKVVKNTLARFAAVKAGKDNVASIFKGPTAIILGYSDITMPAKVLTSYISSSKANLSIKGGFLGDKLLTSEEVTSLATLPPREILLAKVLGQMVSPIAALLSSLGSPISGVIGLLQARIKQLEGT